MFREEQSLEVLTKKKMAVAEGLIVLGSGWNKVIEQVKNGQELSYKEVFGIEASVPGHEGKLITGELAGKQTTLMAGRMHLYEGYSAREATLPYRVLAESGVKRMIVTSASGGLNPKYEVGDFVVLSDLLTLFLLDNPLVGPEFIDMSEVFSTKWRRKAIKAASEMGAVAREGVYAYMHGPHFESFTDKMALRNLGADCVGMSTVPETIQAKALGLEVLGLSLVTNLAFVKHAHSDVLAAAEKASEKMAELLTRVI